MRHIFIINPVAGNGKYKDELVTNIKNEFNNKDLEYEIYFSKYKGDISNFVTNKCKDGIPSVIYACGGDGTVHEVVNSAYIYEHISVGVIPCGSGNDFIKNFNNIENFNNINLQIHGEEVDIDVIKVADKIAVSVCNIGLDADAAFNMHRFKKIPFISGSSKYILAVFLCLLKKLGKKLEVEIDGCKNLKGTFLLGVIANGHSYGGGYKCAPLASINDGILDLCFVDNLSRLQILGFIGSYKEGSHLENPKLKKYITYEKSSYVKIKSNEPVNICVDGENYLYNEAEFSVVKNALKLWLPKGTSLQNSKIMNL